MKKLGKWMLGAAVAAGTMGLGAATAQAAEFGVYVRGPVAYVPPCPGPGYVWISGYYANGYWIPGLWRFEGVRGGVYHDRGWVQDHYRDHDRGWDHRRR